MYLPAVFAESDLGKLHDFIEQYSFGLLTSQVEETPFATHLPFLLDRGAGAHGCLLGHMARANPHWKHAAGQTALAVFSGPHVYVSPSWYEAEQAVPTWNYVAVHAYGPVQILDERPQVLEIVQKMVGWYEQSMPRPWSFADSTVYAERMLAQIVGFRMPLERLEGKWKLNQNQPVERRQKVAQALQQRQDENSQAVAALIQAMLSQAS